MTNWQKPTYHWGFDVYRTRRCYGIGVELYPFSPFIVGIRIGSWLLSWGKQIDYGATMYTNTGPDAKAGDAVYHDGSGGVTTAGSD